MKLSRLDNMKRGWFVGDFEPTVYPTQAVEVGVKYFSAGEAEPRHYHRVATEVTAVLTGRARINKSELGPGDIAVLSPGEPADFEALTDLTLVVVKLPGAPDDKYLGDPGDGAA